VAASFRWLLLLIVLAGAAWAWWRSRTEVPPPVNRSPAVATNRLLTLVPPPAVTSAPPAIVRTSAPPPVAVTSAPPVVVRREPPPVSPAGGYPRPVQDIFEAQVALDRQVISPGCLDGVAGSQTRVALEVFQRKMGLPITGRLDTNTQPLLRLDTPALTTYTVTRNDFARLQPLRATWLGKSLQSTLDFETVLELVAEESFASQNFIQRLNPRVNWANLTVGAVVSVPDAAYPEPRQKAAFMTIRLNARTLEVFDATTNLLAHFPCSIAAKVDKRPVGKLSVAVLAGNPNYTFNPEVFPESDEARELGRKLLLPPGPNNPVGVAWIGLDRPGYGIHGTPSPEQVGRTESHGCFRLANWNAAYLLKLSWVGLPVYVAP
jgi:lipoprotein-anchoring transpeptidase ErfK/SrfK